VLGAGPATKSDQSSSELSSIREFQFEIDDWDNMTANSSSVNGIHFPQVDFAQWYRDGEAKQAVNPCCFDEN